MDFSSIITVCVAGITAAIAAAGLRKYAPEISILAAVAGGIIIIVTVISKVEPLIGEIYDLINLAGVEPEYVQILLKTIGICLAAKFTSEFCNDNGYSSLGSKIEFAGKITVIITAMPLYKNILSTALQLLENT